MGVYYQNFGWGVACSIGADVNIISTIRHRFNASSRGAIVFSVLSCTSGIFSLT